MDAVEEEEQCLLQLSRTGVCCNNGAPIKGFSRCTLSLAIVAAMVITHDRICSKLHEAQHKSQAEASCMREKNPYA